MGSEGSANAVRLLGLEGVEVLEVEQVDGELRVWVQTPARSVGCPSCGVRAESKGRPVVRVRDRPACGQPVVVCWVKRRWRCPERACPRRSWTETSPHVAPRASLTTRARREICRRLGEDADSVAEVARAYGVGWHTAMGAVVEHGAPRVDDPPGSPGSPPWGWTRPAG